MKTKIFGLLAIVCIAFAASFVTNNVSKSSSALSMVAAANVEALAVDDKDNQPGDINPNCENGCVDGGGGCFCYGYYPNLKEYQW